VYDIAFRPDSSQLMSMTRNLTRLWSWNSLPGQPTTISLGTGAGHWSSHYSADGTEVLATTMTDAVIWNTVDGERNMVIPHRKSIGESAWSPDGRTIMTTTPYVVTSGRGPSTTILWDRRSGERGVEMRHGVLVRHNMFSPDGAHVVTCYPGAFRIWDPASGKPMTLMFHESSSNSYGPEVSPDGRALLTVVNGLLRVYPMPYSGPPPAWLPDLAEAVAGQRLNSNGHVEMINRMAEIRARLADVEETGDYGVFGRWFLADPVNRRPCPDPVSAKIYVRP
jgi:WD40 repeat protein